MAESKSRVLYFDLLNILACICVIGMHCNGIVHTYTDSLAWKQALIVEVLAFWAVPVFFMLSGATLMNYRNKYDTKEFFKKRISRTVIPFIAWSLIILILKQFVFHQIDASAWGITGIIGAIFNTKIEQVYWFFIPLFSMYLCMPILSHLTEKKHRKALWYIVGVTFVLQSLLPPICAIFNFTWNYGLNVPVLGGYLLFVILGYLLSTTDLTKKQRLIIYALGIFGVAFRYAMVFYLSTRDGQKNTILFDYTGFYSVFLAIAIFTLFKYINWDKLFSKQSLIKAISKVSSCSFGIYLIHMIIMITLNIWIPQNWQWRIFAPIPIYLICLMVILILKRIPGIKKIVP